MFRIDDKTPFQDMSIKKFTKRCLKKQLHAEKRPTKKHKETSLRQKVLNTASIKNLSHNEQDKEP